MSNVYFDAYLKNNLGDDLFVWILCSRYPEIKFHTYSEFDYSWLENRLPNLSVSKKPFCIPDKLAHSAAVIYGRRRADVYLRIGGSIFIQKERTSGFVSLISDLFYKFYVTTVINIYKDIFILGANYGPSFTSSFDKSNKLLFCSSKDVCFRDEKSYRRFEEIEQVRFAPDIVFSYQIEGRLKEKSAFVSVVNLYNKNKFNYSDSVCATYEDDMFKTCLELSNSGYSIVMSGFCEHEQDSAAVSNLEIRLKKYGVVCHVINYDRNLENVLAEIEKSEILVGARFHSIVLGLISGCKVLPVVYGEKTSNMLQMVGIPKEAWYVIGKSDGKMPSLLSKCFESPMPDLSRLIADAEDQFMLLDCHLGRI